jgi:hypothetical protein
MNIYKNTVQSDKTSNDGEVLKVISNGETYWERYNIITNLFRHC